MPDNAPRNIVYIMLDDADFYDFGYQGLPFDDPDAITPNIDFLRENGMAFTNFYAAGPVCTPTRVSVLTGDNPLAYGATHVWPQLEAVVQGSASVNGIVNDHAPMMGQVMKDLGLATGHFGKWHVGSSRTEYLHEAAGFDNWAFFNKTAEDGDFSDRAGVTEFVTDHGTYVKDVDDVDIQFTDEIIDFIHDSADADQPFYLNFWPLTPHTPIYVPRGFDNSETNFDLTTDRGKLLAMMYMIDQQVGRLIAALQEIGQLDDTLIMVTSDNGGLERVQNAYSDLRGDKGTVWEGGIKVPMTAFWPNGIEAGTTNESVMTTADLLPTFVDLLGGDPDPMYSDISGRSLADAFTDNLDIRHDPILWQREGVAQASDNIRADSWYALRVDDYKLVKRKGRDDLHDDAAYSLADVSVTGQEFQNLLNGAELEIGHRMIKMLLEMRLAESRMEEFPQAAFGPRNIDFDPRCDVGSKDMTLHFKLSGAVDVPTVIYEHPGSQTLTLLPDGRLQWTITGTMGNSSAVTRELFSDPLTAGEHEITLAIKGYKAGKVNVALMVDHVVVAELTPDDPQSFFAVWSSHEDITLGGDGVSITGARFYTLNFFADELDQIYRAPSLAPTFGTIEADVIAGTNGAEALFGARGDDLLVGRRGNDELFGGAGDDRLAGGIGADLLDGGMGIDTAMYSADSGPVTANLADPSANSGSAAGDIYVDIENLVGTRRFGDVLTGDDGDNRIDGLGGDDVIDGGRGDDTLIGGQGSDTFRFSPGTGYDRVIDYRPGDVLDFRAFGIGLIDGFDNVIDNAAGNVVLYIGGDKVAIVGTTSAQLEFVTDGMDISGTNDAETLTGGAFSDRINGLGGDDIIIGRGGDDFLIGGSGADTFVFEEGFGFDRVMDYEAGDRLDLTALGITSLDQFDYTNDAPGSGNAILGIGADKIVVADTRLADIVFVGANNTAARDAMDHGSLMAAELEAAGQDTTGFDPEINMMWAKPLYSDFMLLL